MYYADDLSRSELCTVLPVLYRKIEPDRLPIREAVKRLFSWGVSEIMNGNAEAPYEARMKLLEAAADRGFIYPEGEPYELANDFAFWLDGGLRIVQEFAENMAHTPVYRLGNNDLFVDAYEDRNIAHVFRITDDVRLKWPELILFSLGEFELVELHTFRLPGVRGGRLASPLNLGYQHPLTGNIRLAKRDDEAGFGPKWKRIGRWEGDYTWREWRDGIDADQCLPLIYSTTQIENPYSQTERKHIVEDALSIVRSKEKTRKREMCHACMYEEYCHGTGEDFVERREETLYQVR